MSIPIALCFGHLLARGSVQRRASALYIHYPSTRSAKRSFKEVWKSYILAPKDERESAIEADLAAGHAFTVIVRGLNDTAGWASGHFGSRRTLLDLRCPLMFT